jgi:hypothetical protein
MLSRALFWIRHANGRRRINPKGQPAASRYAHLCQETLIDAADQVAKAVPLLIAAERPCPISKSG